MAYKLLIENIKEVVQITTKNVPFLTGNEMKNIKVLRQHDDSGASGYSILVNKSGKIETIDTTEEIRRKYSNSTFDVTIDAKGMVVVPGLVDAHTHPVWDGDRVHEFSMKCVCNIDEVMIIKPLFHAWKMVGKCIESFGFLPASKLEVQLSGATYMEVHQAGGGIHFTVDHTRRADENRLLQLFLDRAKWMLSCGTTLMEAKSGYGLDAENEMKMLSVLERAKSLQPVEISSTFCGAHAVPKGQTADQATNNVIDVQLVALKKELETKNLTVENVDVFCEEGVFTIDQSRKILQAGRKLSLNINFHGDELHATGSAELGASLNAMAISHLEKISKDGIEAMAKSGSVAVLLPSTAYILRLQHPPVREMIDANVPIALGSDFNPNAFCYSMPMIMHLACVLFHMNLEEALVAATLNAAASIGRGLTHGSLQPGRHADMLILDVPKWEHLIYQFGCHDKIIKHVIKSGSIVYSTKHN